MVNNKVILIGRMVRDAAVGLSGAEEQKTYAHFTLAVDKGRRKSEEEDNPEEGSSANFINCVAFDKQAVFLEQYGRKGVKFAVEGHLNSGSYEKNEVMVYTTEVVVENIQFCERKEQVTD